MTPFLLTSCFRMHPITLLLEILGGRMRATFAWTVPISNFEGAVPLAVPAKSPPVSFLGQHRFW